MGITIIYILICLIIIGGLFMFRIDDLNKKIAVQDLNHKQLLSDCVNVLFRVEQLEELIVQPQPQTLQTDPFKGKDGLYSYKHYKHRAVTGGENE
jgi:hypothetical protein